MTDETQTRSNAQVLLDECSAVWRAASQKFEDDLRADRRERDAAVEKRREELEKERDSSILSALKLAGAAADSAADDLADSPNVETLAVAKAAVSKLDRLVGAVESMLQD